MEKPEFVQKKTEEFKDMIGEIVGKEMAQSITNYVEMMLLDVFLEGNLQGICKNTEIMAGNAKKIEK